MERKWEESGERVRRESWERVEREWQETDERVGRELEESREEWED